MLKWSEIIGEVISVEIKGSHFDSGDFGYSEYIKIKFVHDDITYTKETPYKVGRLPIQMPFTKSVVRSGLKTGDKVKIFINPKDKSELVFKKKIIDIISIFLFIFSTISLLLLL